MKGSGEVLLKILKDVVPNEQSNWPRAIGIFIRQLKAASMHLKHPFCNNKRPQFRQQRRTRQEECYRYWTRNNYTSSTVPCICMTFLWALPDSGSCDCASHIDAQQRGRCANRRMMTSFLRWRKISQEWRTDFLRLRYVCTVVSAMNLWAWQVQSMVYEASEVQD